MAEYGEPWSRNCPWCAMPITAAYERDWSSKYFVHLTNDCHHVDDRPGADD